jgi:hypothetical protein
MYKSIPLKNNKYDNTNTNINTNSNNLNDDNNIDNTKIYKYKFK